MMPNATSVLRKTLIAVAATGVLSFGAVGTVGPAGASTATLGPKAQAQAEKHFNCANAARRLGHRQRVEARFAKKMAHLNQAEAKATKSGNTKVAAYWKKLIARQQKIESHTLGTKAKARAAQRDAMITAKCHVAAPSSSSGTATS